MGQIRITPEQMRARANEYRAEAGNVANVISKMDNLLAALENEWEGESARAYSSRFAELRPSFVKAQTLIEEIAKSLDSTATNIEVTDQEIARQMQS